MYNNILEMRQLAAGTCETGWCENAESTWRAFLLRGYPHTICGPQEHHACLCAGVAGIAAGQACMLSARNAYFSLHYVQLRSCTYIKKLSAAFSVPECPYQSHVI